MLKLSGMPCFLARAVHTHRARMPAAVIESPDPIAADR
jgi:hypothetical protein